MLRATLALITLIFVAPFHMASAQEPSQPAYLYKTSLVQAAPGKLLDLIDAYKKIFSEESKVAGDTTPLWMRHSQGDRWDLLILYPMGSYSDYYKPDRVIKRDTVLDPWRDRLKSDIAWQEDVFVYGPPLEDVRKAFAVSWGRFQYPGKTFGPRTTISSFSASFISTPRIAGPARPGCTWPGSSMVQMAVVSVSP